MFNRFDTYFIILFFAFIINFPLLAQEKSHTQKKIDSLRTILTQKTHLDTLSVKQMNEVARLLSHERQLDLATNYAQKAIKSSRKINFKNGEAEAYDILGMVYAFKSNYPESLKNLFVSLKKWQESGDKLGVAVSYIHIGNVYRTQGKYPEALKKYFEALKISEKIDNKPKMAMSYNGIGVVYRNQKKYAKALENHFTSLEISNQIGDKYSVSTAYTNIGIVYDYEGNYSEALKYYTAALKIQIELSDKHGILGSYNNIGVIYNSQGNYAKALQNFFAALKILEEIGGEWEIAATYVNIGLAEYNLNRPVSAKKHYEKALVVFKETENISYLEDLYYNLVLVDRALGDYKGAYENYKQFIIYRDSLKNEEAEKRSLEVSMGYEYDKKAAVIKAQLKTEKLERNAAIIGLGFVLVLGIFIVYFFKLRNKKLKVEKQNLELKFREMEAIKEKELFKSRFLANISHEFRTPLTLINAHVEVLKEKGRSEDFSHFDEIEQNGKRLLILINQLLDISKMESGQYKLQYIEGNILNEVNMLVQSFHSYAKQHGISLILDLTESVKDLTEKPFVYSSEALVIIMTNLMSNAIKYTPFGGNITTIIDYRDDKLFISITDTGQGISKEHLPKIFDRFYQVDESDQRTNAGTGIGLALVKELIELHGGSIWVESPEEGGCTFSFWIESSTEEVVESTVLFPPNNSVYRNKENQFINVENENAELPLLLVVEDQPELQSFMVENLGNEYRYLVASNGTDGIKLAEELLPDLIISDVMMPDTSGFELCETLKNNVATSHIPIILLTAKAEQEDKLTGLEIGADDYLTKPFSLAELKLRVRNILTFKEMLREKFKGNIIPTVEDAPELNLRDRKFVDDVTQSVEKNISNFQFGVNVLAEDVFLSVSQLTRKLKAITGKTPADFIRNIRLEKAVELLKNGENIADVSWSVGFEDAVYFSKVFKKHYGFPPSSIKK